MRVVLFIWQTPIRSKLMPVYHAVPLPGWIPDESSRTALEASK